MRHLISLSLVLLLIGCTQATDSSEEDLSPVYQQDTLTINGIRQIILVQGASRELPLLLYLHGGPGESVMSKAREITGRLSEEFLVVHWDQRGAGATAALNPDDPSPDMNLMMSDVRLMTEHLLETFDREELYLAGHSWGTVPGFHLARQIPEKITAFIAISPPVDEIRSTEILLDTLKNHFRKKGNTRAVSELDTIDVPMANLEQMIALHRWQSEYHGKPVTDEEVLQYLPYLRNWEKQWWTVYQSMARINRTGESLNFECPVIFILGTQDLQTNVGVSKDYFQSIDVPFKKLYLVDSAGHNLPGEYPEQMQENILEVKAALEDE